MTEIQNSIVFIGMTCSGKSTIANELSKLIPYKKASFGGYLYNYAHENKFDTKKENLQIIGQEFIENDFKQFFSDVLKFSKAGNNVIFEGVRHLVIQNEIKNLSYKTLSFFLDTPYDIRYKRFNFRETDKITEDQFHILDSHPVEKQIELLKSTCDVILDGKKDILTITTEVLSKINERIM